VRSDAPVWVCVQRGSADQCWAGNGWHCGARLSDAPAAPTFSIAYVIGATTAPHFFDGSHRHTHDHPCAPRFTREPPLSATRVDSGYPFCSQPARRHGRLADDRSSPRANLRGRRVVPTPL
ncbi:MAG: hypothetical protein AVDCRST_MAG93-2352, partial [uncultured Chloroflexia bacterium]